MNGRAFPVIAITRRTFAALFGDVRHFLQHAFLWAAGIAGARLLYAWLRTAGWFADDLSPAHTALQAGTFLLMAVATTGMAIPWHRHLLIGAGAPRASRAIYARYALRVTVLLVVLLLVPHIVFTAVRLYVSDGLVAQIAFASCLIVAGFFVCRFALVLPAISSNAAHTRFYASWNMTKGNALRVFVGCTVLIGCVDIFNRAATALLRGIVEFVVVAGVYTPASHILSAITWMIAVGFVTTYLSLAYRFFTPEERRDVDTLREAFE